MNETFEIGERVLFVKSGVEVTIIKYLGRRFWTVEKDDGTRMTATSGGMSKL